MPTASMPVPQAFQQFLEALEITKAQHKRAREQYVRVREALNARLKIDEAFMSGSFARRTAIRPLHDIDLFIVLSEHTHGGLRSQSPKVCLDAVQRALQAAYPGPVLIRPQYRSVKILFKSTDIGYDVVPAFQNKRDTYIIPDLERESWIPTNPARHAELCKQANERAGNMLNGLIKAAKHWNVVHGRKLRSFHLEVMAYSAFRQRPPDLLDGFAQLLDHLARAIRTTCPNPIVAGPPIDGRMPPERRQDLARQLGNAAKKVQLAVELTRQNLPGTVAQAHQILRALLGDVYPGR